MITANYQTFGNKGFQLRLRLYQSGETKFVNVTKFLKGDLKKQHWNQSKQLFTPSCPYRDENNDTLALIKQKYHEYSVNWVGSIAGMLASMDERESVETNGLSLSGFIHHVIAKLQSNKHADGSPKCSHEAYEKCEKRLQEYCASKKSNIRNT